MTRILHLDRPEPGDRQEETGSRAVTGESQQARCPVCCRWMYAVYGFNGRPAWLCGCGETDAKPQ